MELQVGSPPQDQLGWSSWSALHKGRKRNPYRLSASVESISAPYDNEYFVGSQGSISNMLTNYPDLEVDGIGSVNNILDTIGGGTGISSSIGLGGKNSNSTVALSQLHYNGQQNQNHHHRHQSSTASSAHTHLSASNNNTNTTANNTSTIGTINSLVDGQMLCGELSVVAKNDNDSSGVGSGGSGCGASASPTGSTNVPQEEYEHMYCKLDPYFSPPIKPGLNSRSSNTRASLRSWAKSSTSMDNSNSAIVPFMQQALASRYREMLDIYLQPPSWYRAQMGSSDLDEICPCIYQVLPEKNPTSIYGTTSNKFSSAERHQDNYKPILPHQIFKSSEDDTSRAFWLEGSGGSGKTLLCLKLINEWVDFQSYNYTNTPLNTRLGEFEVVFYIPLREVRGSIKRFILKELIPARSILTRMKPANIWRCLNYLGSQVLFIIDDIELANPEALTEIQDILNGHLFPQSMIFFTTAESKKYGDKLFGPAKRFLCNGLDWPQIQCLIKRFFTGKKSVLGNEMRKAEIAINLLLERSDLSLLASNPFMNMLLCTVLDQMGDLPTSNAELYSYLLRSLLYHNGLIRVDSSCKDFSIPSRYQRILQDFGKLALTKLSESKNSSSRVQYLESELADSDIIKCGILSRPRGFFRTAKKGSNLVILHPSLNTFLSAYYLSTISNYPNIVRREIEMLPAIETLGESKVQSSVAFQVIHLVMELLQKKSASLFSTMNLLDVSINYLLAMLRASGFFEPNVSAVCNILRHFKQMTINVSSEWGSEWKQILASSTCPFESIELVLKPGYSLNRIIEGLCLNESISNVKFSSTPGQEWSGVEINLICGQLLKLLSEKKLKCLEISMTCLQDKEHNKFQPIVDSLNYFLSKQIPIQKMILDMDLTCSQVIQLAAFIRAHHFLEVIHLPHLGTGADGFRAIATMLQREKPFVSVSLAGAWRSTNETEEEYDSVISMEQLTPLFPVKNNHHHQQQNGHQYQYNGGVFSSLPRLGHGISNGSIKSPSIRRKKQIGVQNRLTANDDDSKRNSDTALFQKNFLPVPTCDKENHEIDGFHGIFAALRNDNFSCLRSLNLSKSVLNWEDVVCLGETIRKTKCLDSLRMEGMKLCDVLPVLLGLQENSCLKMLELSSQHVVIADDAIQLVSSSLAKNKTLRLLSIQGWTFYIEEEKSLESLENLFRSSSLQDLDLSGVRVHISSSNKMKMLKNGIGNLTTSPSTNSNSNGTSSGCSFLANSNGKSATIDRDNCSRRSTLDHKLKKKEKKSMMNSDLNIAGSFANKYYFPELSYIRLGGMQVEIQKSQIWRSMDILGYLLPKMNRERIRYLDISLDRNESLTLISSPTSVGNSANNANFVEEKVVMKTLKLIGSQLPRLQTLHMQHWRMRISLEKSYKELSKAFNSLDSLTSVNLDYCVVNTEIQGSNTLRRVDHLFTSSLLANIRNLTEFSWTNFEPSQLIQLAKVLSEIQRTNLTLKFDLVPIHSIRQLIKNTCAGKPNSTLVLEYIGNNSISVHRPQKDKNEHFMTKLKKLL